MAIAFIILAALFVAYTNGANDNFKGVATLFGSGTVPYRSAIIWATVTTAAGVFFALAVSSGLIARFGGKGLVPDAVAASPEFLLSIALGAAVTVLIATLTGFPISTTHALMGALVGAGLVSGGAVNWAVLGGAFVLPLLISPIVAAALTLGLYPLFRAARRTLGVSEEACLCVGKERALVPVPVSEGWNVVPGGVMKLSTAQVKELPLHVSVGTEATCVTRYDGRVWGISAQRALDGLHVLSAGTMSFARGWNDAPKIVAILFAAKALRLDVGLTAVAVAMALGGLLQARRVAVTVSRRVTSMNAGQGFTANLVTAMLVVVACFYSLPVSTTHVSVGSLFGIGAASGSARWRKVRDIGISWIITLPVAAVLAATSAAVIRAL